MTSSKRKLKRAEIESEPAEPAAKTHPVLQSFLLSLLFLTCFLISCTPSTTPEQIVDGFITVCEKSIEKGSGRELRNLIAEDYMDSSGRTKQALGAIASGYLLRNKAIYCYRLIDSVIINEDDSISARVLTALAAQPITDVAILPQINSDIYWFDVTIAEQNDEWKLINASWKKAMLEDFFQ